LQKFLATGSEIEGCSEDLTDDWSVLILSLRELMVALSVEISAVLELMMWAIK